MSVLNGEVKGVEPVLVNVGDICSVCQQDVHHPQVTFSTGQVEGSDLVGTEGGSSPSLLLMNTRQYYLEETNHDLPQCLEQGVKKEAESMTVFLWVLSQWYAQTDSALIQICITLQSYSSTLKIYLCYFNPVWSPQLHSFCVLGT